MSNSSVKVDKEFVPGALSSMAGSLVTWINTFLEPAKKIKALSDLADGEILSDILATISPSFFDTRSIKRDVGANYLLRVTNIRKIISRLTVYWTREGSDAILEYLAKIDIHAIGKYGSEQELTKLVEVILLVAVECANKQQFISAIMKLDNTVQAQLMVCIEQLLHRRATKKPSPHSLSSPSLGVGSALGPVAATSSDDTQMLELASALEDTKSKLEELQQDYSNVLAENATLRSEKDQHLAMIKALEHALAEHEKENERVRAAAAAAAASAATPGLAGVVTSASEREKELHEANLALQHELDAKTAALAEARRRIDTELPRLQKENRNLRDELDILKEQVADAEKHRRAAAKLQLKTEELADLRCQLKVAEEMADEYMRKALALEEDSKKVASLKSQLESYKEQLAAAVAARTEAETLAASRGMEISKLRDVISAMETEMTALRRQLEAHEATRPHEHGAVGVANGPAGGDDTADDVLTAGSPLPKALSAAILTPEIKEQVFRLERENQRLRTAAEKVEELENQLDDAKRLIARYQEDKLAVTQRIERLSEQVVQLQAATGGAVSTTTPTSPRQSSEKLLELEAQLYSATERLRAAETKLTAAQARVEQLEKENQRLLAAAAENSKSMQELDTLRAELRLRSEKIEALNAEKGKLETYLRTAKSMIKKLKEQVPAVENEKKQLQDELAKCKLQHEVQLQALKQQLQEKEEMLAINRRAWEESKESSQRELQLVVSAFYGMGLELQRLKAPQLGIPAGTTTIPPSSPMRDMHAGGAAPASPRGPAPSTSFLSALRRAV